MRRALAVVTAAAACGVAAYVAHRMAIQVKACACANCVGPAPAALLWLSSPPPLPVHDRSPPRRLERPGFGAAPPVWVPPPSHAVARRSMRCSADTATCVWNRCARYERAWPGWRYRLSLSRWFSPVGSLAGVARAGPRTRQCRALPVPHPCRLHYPLNQPAASVAAAGAGGEGAGVAEGGAARAHASRAQPAAGAGRPRARVRRNRLRRRRRRRGAQVEVSCLPPPRRRYLRWTPNAPHRL
jgi:hypothetical protein